MVDFAKINKKNADRKIAAEIIVDEIIQEVFDQIAWADRKLELEFREKYVAKICRIP